MLSFFIRILFADEHVLGYDPTMAVHTSLGDGSRQYDIVVRQDDGTCHTYRTKRLLSNGGGAYLQGRGTRVWHAVRLEDGVETGDPVALKDSWVDAHREREASVNSRIRGAVTSQADRHELDGLIVQISAHGDVYVSGVPDCTHAEPTRKPSLLSPSIDL